MGCLGSNLSLNIMGKQLQDLILGVIRHPVVSVNCLSFSTNYSTQDQCAPFLSSATTISHPDLQPPLSGIPLILNAASCCCPCCCLPTGTDLGGTGVNLSAVISVCISLHLAGVEGGFEKKSDIHFYPLASLPGQRVLASKVLTCRIALRVYIYMTTSDCIYVYIMLVCAIY